MEIEVTENARARISELSGGRFFRLGVDGGSCQGFAYSFGFTDELRDGDTCFSHEGAMVIVDRVSMAFLVGSRLDYISSLASERFEVSNPNAVSTCGCGSSFSV